MTDTLPEMQSLQRSESAKCRQSAAGVALDTTFVTRAKSYRTPPTMKTYADFNLDMSYCILLRHPYEARS